VSLPQTHFAVHRLAGLPCCLAIAALFAAPARADVEWKINTGVGFSDNIQRAATNEVNETIATAGFTLALQENTRLFNADVDADLAYYEYLDNTYDGEVVGDVDAKLIYEAVPERFRWTLEDNFGQSRLNQFSADRPDNRENINLLSTGPDLTFRLGTAFTFHLGGRYELTTYESSPLDSERLIGTAALQRDVSQVSSLSLVADYETTEYDNQVSINEYQVQSLFARYMVNGARTKLSLDLGYTVLTELGEDSGGVYSKLDLSRQVSQSTRLTLRAGSEYSNGGDAFRRVQSSRDVGSGPITVQPTPDAFEDRFVGLGWVYDRSRTSVRLDVSYNMEIYQERSELDRSYIDVRGSVKRQLSPVASIRIGAEYARSEYENQPYEDKELIVLAGFEWMLGSMLDLGITYERYDRDGKNVGDEYAENQAWVRLIYGAVEK